MAKHQYNFNYDETLPTVIVKDRVLTVNNRKSTMKALKKGQADLEAKAEKEGRAVTDDEASMLLISTICGKDAAKFVESLDLPIPVFKDLLSTIMAAYQGITVEELEKQTNTRV